jgi:cytochrome c
LDEHVLYLLLLAAIALAPTSGMVRAQNLSFGDRLYHEKADCQFCHGIDGDGRGDPR